MKRTNPWMVLLALLGMVPAAAGMEITLEQAESAVGNWIARGGGFGALSGGGELSGETFEDPETGAKMHVVRVPGRGFAVTSADDGIEPVVFFSDGDGDFVPSEGNPVWDLLRWDLEARTRALDAEEKADAAGGRIPRRTSGSADGTPQGKWADLLELGTGSAHGTTPKATANVKTRISDIRREALLDTTWGQTFANVQHSTHYAYNYYTPGKLEVVPVAQPKGSRSPSFRDSTAYETNEVGHYPCGCVATAGGQLMKKWGYPSAPKSKKTVTCTRDGENVQLTMIGGPYNWSGMGGAEPSTPGQCEAVGRILFDIGVSCGADYTAGGTSMSPSDLAKNLRTVFGYASATWFGTAFYEFESTVLERLKKVAIPNLDARAPILLSIKRSRFNESINHCVVADGYGYDNGSFGLHVNFGWNGAGNGWYVPPSFHPDSVHDYDFIRGVVGNVFPHGSGSVASGRAEGSHGRPVSGVEVRLCTPSGTLLQTAKTGNDGVYWFREEPGEYVVEAGVGGSTAVTGSLTLGACGDDTIGNAVQDWTLASVPAVAAISALSGGGTATSRDAGDATFSAPFEVRLSSATPGAEIRYTLDGTQPGPESALYEGALDIQDTTTLRAVAFADGMECSGEFERTWTFDDPRSRDDFADARPISGASGKSSFDNTGYTKEAGEPTHGDYRGGASAWATWTALAEGDWTFWLEGTGTNGTSALDTQLAIYTGDTLQSLSLVAANDNQPEGGYSSRLSFHAEGGTAYRIAMDTLFGDEGTLRLRWEEGYLHWVVPDYASRFVPRSGGRHGFRVRSSTGWRVAEYTEPVVPVAMEGESGADFVFEVPENGTGAERRATVTFQAGNAQLAAVSLIQHPSLDFATTKEEALVRAFRENKRILLVQGRETCGNTRNALFSVIPSAAVKALVDEGYVLWYSNCDVQTDSRSYAAGLGSYTLPLIAILDPQDMSTPVARTTGPQSADGLLALLEEHADWGGILAVATEMLPEATAGEPYEAALEASGGTPPYAWRLEDGYSERAAAGTFAETGTARGWQGDDACWDLPLPFAFPFFGHSYTNAKVNSNGTISFGNESFTAYSYNSVAFLGTPVIAVLWNDLTTAGGDIFVETAGDRVKVAWKGAYYGGGAVAFSATLHADGTIVLSYGEGNGNGGAIGVSAGDGSTSLLSAKTNSGSMENAADIVFELPGALPDGLSLSDAGVLQGTPGKSGTYAFTVVLADAKGLSVTKELSLAVRESGTGPTTVTTPVAVPHAWLAEHGLGDGTAEGCEAAAKAPAANGMPVWACYVAGLVPTDAAAAFRVKSFSLVEGEPVIVWEPGLDAERTYTVEGKASMADEWGPCGAASRFFRVKVKLSE